MKRGNLSNCVKIYRTKMEMTQEDLSGAVGVSRQTIIAIEKGDYIPSVYLAIKICEELGKSVEEVFQCLD